MIDPGMSSGQAAPQKTKNRKAEKPPGEAKGSVLRSEALKGERAEKRKPKAGAC